MLLLPWIAPFMSGMTGHLEGGWILAMHWLWFEGQHVRGQDFVVAGF